MSKQIIEPYIYQGDKGNICYYTNEIRPNRDTIIMLHPAFADHQIFNRQVEFFHENYNLILLDLPGHGKTNAYKTSLNMEDVPNIINDILMQHHIVNAHILGVSLGSLISQGFADCYPNKTKSVTVVGGYSIHKNNEDVMNAQKKEMGKWLFYVLFNMNKLRKHIVDVSVISEEGKYLMGLGTSYVSRRTFLSMNGMNHIFRQTDEEKEYPLLALVGEQDLPIAKRAALKLGYLSNGYCQVIENAGHCANIDNYHKFNLLYEEFIMNKSIKFL